MDSRDGSSLSPDGGLNQEKLEKISSVWVQQVIDTAAEDWKNQEPNYPHELGSASRPPKGGFQFAAQESFSGEDNRRVCLQDASSFREKLLGHLGAFGGDDSGCGSCFSEDASDAEGLTRELSEEGQEFVMTPIEANTVGIESKMTPCMLGVTEEEEEALRGV